MDSVSLKAKAAGGDADAQLELGRRFEASGNTIPARVWLARAAKAGNTAALCSLGVNLMTQEPTERQGGVNMVRAAADKGDAEAAHLCAILAGSDVNLPNRWDVARQCLEVATERGWAFARQQLEFLASSRLQFDGPLPLCREVSSTPRISVIDGFATAEECEWLKMRAAPRLARARVYDPGADGWKIAHARTNSSAEFGILQADIVLVRLRARIEAITGINRLEGSTILHYAPGEEFKPHYDFLDPATPGYLTDLANNGQRIATFLIYLNEEFDGGETAFPKLDWRFRGKKGDALLFWNLTKAGEPDPLTYHAGLATTSGEKWLFSQWLREPLARP